MGLLWPPATRFEKRPQLVAKAVDVPLVVNSRAIRRTATSMIQKDCSALATAQCLPVTQILRPPALMYSKPRPESVKRAVTKMRTECLGRINTPRGSPAWSRKEPEHWKKQSYPGRVLLASLLVEPDRIRTGRYPPLGSTHLNRSRECKYWWAVRDSNPRHPACKAGALTN